MSEIFLNDWKESGRFGMIADFEDIYITKKEYEAKSCPIQNEKYWLEKKAEMRKVLANDEYKINILLASYAYEDYCGDAFVLFKRGGKLFEVNGGHCSCYGLEGQWEPEETSIESLYHRLNKGHLGSYDYNPFAEELREVLGKFKSEGK